MRRILVVDDDPHITRLYTKALKHIGHETRSVQSVPDAINILEEFIPEVICLDWHVGKEIGGALLEHIQAKVALAQHPQVLVITGKFTTIDMSPYGKLVNKVLLKPVTPRELNQHIKNLPGSSSPVDAS